MKCDTLKAKLHIYGGAPYPLRVMATRKLGGVMFDGVAVTLAAPPGSTARRRKSIVDAWRRDALKGKLRELLPKWEAATGMGCAGFSVRAMRSRWGTCYSESKRIVFNSDLAQLPVECVEYVVLHELAHTIECNHGARFKAILDRFMPDWRAIECRMDYRNLPAGMASPLGSPAEPARAKSAAATRAAPPDPAPADAPRAVPPAPAPGSKPSAPGASTPRHFF